MDVKLRDYNIVNLNEVLAELFRQTQNDLRREAPNFEVGKLMVAQLAFFHLVDTKTQSIKRLEHVDVAYKLPELSRYNEDSEWHKF